PVRGRPVRVEGAREEAAGAPEPPAEADQRVARASPGQDAEQALAGLAAQRLDLPGAGRIVTQEAQGRPDRAEGHARDPRDPSAANARDLEAPAAQIDDRAAVQRSAPQDGRGAEPRLFPAAQYPHLHAL